MSTLYIASTGGHLEQLHHLAGRIEGGGEGHWVTFDNAQSRALLSGREVTFVPYVGVRDLRGVIRCLPVARRLRRRLPVTRAVSTGSGIALGFLPYLSARGVECHYIESAARVRGPSLTGMLLRRTPGVATHTQYAGWDDPGWRPLAGVFQAFRPAAERRAPGPVLRVVVTVGTAAEFPFRRLVGRLATLLAPGGPLERAAGRPASVLWQTGATPVDDLGIRATPYLRADELVAALREADLVVAHAGTGSALAALATGRLPLLAPRRRARGEAGDDHQEELGLELAARGLAVYRPAEAIEVGDLLAVAGASVERIELPPLALTP